MINMGAHLHNIFPNLPKGATMEKIADNLAAFIAKSSFKRLTSLDEDTNICTKL